MVDALYDSMATKLSFDVEGMSIQQATLQTKNEDRTTVFEFEHGTMIAIFDGHYTDEVSEYASSILPRAIADRISTDTASGILDIPHIMKTEIQDFDDSLLRGFTDQFDDNEDFTDEKWGTDGGYVYGVTGYKGDPTFQIARRAIVGSTALIAFINKPRTHVWVASLGDSDAVCGRKQDGKWVPIMLSSHHNASNPEEVERINREHPGEEGIIQYGYLMGRLSVTRALGDHQLKAPFSIASRGLVWIYKGTVSPAMWAQWKEEGHVNMPYMSNVPGIQCHELIKGDMLVFASDGLRDCMPPLMPIDEHWDILVSLANGVSDSQYDCIFSGENVAESVIKNLIFGVTDLETMEKEMAERDNISVGFSSSNTINSHGSHLTQHKHES